MSVHVVCLNKEILDVDYIPKICSVTFSNYEEFSSTEDVLHSSTSEWLVR